MGLVTRALLIPSSVVCCQRSSWMPTPGKYRIYISNGLFLNVQFKLKELDLHQAKNKQTNKQKKKKNMGVWQDNYSLYTP